MDSRNKDGVGETSRRSLLAAAAGLPFAGMFGLTGLPARAATGMIAGHDPKLVPAPAVLDGWLKTLHTFGPVRHTGTAPARAFEEWLAKEFARLGCTIERDQFKLTSWEATVEQDCAITVQEDGGATRKLEVLAYYPYSGSTRGKAPAKGRVLYAGTGDAAVKDFMARTPAAQLAESIVVIDMPIKDDGAQQGTKIYDESFPRPLPPLVGEPHPANRMMNGMVAMASLEKKCKGLILCYTDVNRDAVRYNYLPFTDKHRQIPALWTGKPESDYLRSVSGKAVVTVRLDAKLTPNARADTILATMKGETDEVVLMTTQTDGPNECNENGAIGLLACATYLSKLKNRKRTFVFSLPTGHYAFGPVADPVTGSGRLAGTFAVVARWPDVIKRSVAQISLEQMAASEWAAVNGKWQATGRPAQQHWLPTPSVAGLINRMFLAAAAGESPKYIRADIIKDDSFAGGEGSALRMDKIPERLRQMSKGLLGDARLPESGPNIPGIGLMGWPHYFFRADPKGVIDKLDPNILHAQVSLVTKLLVLMGRLTPAQLKGKSPITDKDLFGA